MDFIIWVIAIAAVLSLGIAIGAIFSAIITKDAKDVADEFTKATKSVQLEAESILSRLRAAEQDVITKAQAIKKAL